MGENMKFEMVMEVLEDPALEDPPELALGLPLPPPQAARSRAPANSSPTPAPLLVALRMA
ncbi:MAG TPA: hypothetical protein VHV57_08960 [Acidimicrobiales bacterium]|jgi:hypothetical protein|nr:hypothetical protein [Acidimicrobiales bacterium]